MPEPYLSIEAVSELLGVDPKTVRNKMYDGTLKRGVHWFSPKGLRPRFKWSEIVKWIEESEKIPDPEKVEGGIPMRRGYLLGNCLKTAGEEAKEQSDGMPR